MTFKVSIIKIGKCLLRNIFFPLFYICILFSYDRSVEDKFFTSHGFISLATRITSTLSWILEKLLLKPKRAHIYTKRRQNPWRYYLIKARGLNSWHIISFLAHDLSS